MWYHQLQGTESTISCAFCPYSPKLVNKATLHECEFLSKKLWITGVLNIRTWLQLAMSLKPAHPVQEDFDFLIKHFNFIFFIFLYLFIYLFICNFEVFRFILVLENNVTALLTNQLFLLLLHVLYALSWTFMSLPVSCGVCSQFVSYLVKLVSLLYTVYIYIYIYLRCKTA